jgi:uncharacterized protein YqjF (DUF2071 family)
MHCETYGIQKPLDSISDAARRRMLSVSGEPLFLADWLRLVFIHYEVPAQELQSDVPFELDLFEDKAYVSLVAFTMRGMRPRIGGRFGAWLLKPIASNEYLNVRTYVRHRNESGIYFLTEWMNNPLSVWLGPWTFGLPYRLGRLNYRHDHEAGALDGLVRENRCGSSLAYHAELKRRRFAPCAKGSLEEFLLERYTAFTCHAKTKRFFRVWHPPWPQTQITVSVSNYCLLTETWPWFAHARLAGANYSPGAQTIWMGCPHSADNL